MELVFIVLGALAVPIILVTIGLIILGSLFSILRKDQDSKSGLFDLEDGDF